MIKWVKRSNIDTETRPGRSFFVSRKDTMNQIEIAKQVSDLIRPIAATGKMLPKTPKDIERLLNDNRGFMILCDGIVVAFAGFYDWPKYLEIGSLIVHPSYQHQGLAKQVTLTTIAAAKKYADKPIIALVNSESAGLLESFGFRTKTREEKLQDSFWDPCKDTCVDYGRWPKCNCNLMELELE